jgi:hypothetical protein
VSTLSTGRAIFQDLIGVLDCKEHRRNIYDGIVHQLFEVWCYQCLDIPRQTHNQGEGGQQNTKLVVVLAKWGRDVLTAFTRKTIVKLGITVRECDVEYDVVVWAYDTVVIIRSRDIKLV